MAEIARITAVVTANTSQFTRGMKAADAQTRATAASMKGASGAAVAAERSMARVGASSKVAAAGMKAAKVAMGALAVTAFIGYKEMQRQERVSTNTANTLKNVGNSAGFTVAKVEELSASLARQTGMQDDVIQGAANLLLGFKDIGNNAQVFDKVLAASMDRAAKTGRDLVATTRAIGFAYQSPISGVGMLRRAGILLTKDTQKQIKEFEQAGKIEQARALLLDKVASSAKGAAKALGQTSTGQVARLKEQFGQMAESVFKAVIPALLEIGPPLIEMMKAAAPAFAAIGKGIAAVVTPVARMFSSLMQNRAAVIALAAAFSAFIAIGIASKIAGMVTALRGLAGATAAAGAAATATTGMGAAAGGAVGKIGLFARTASMIHPVAGALVGAVGLGVAALFAFRNEMSAGQRIMQGLSERTAQYRSQVTQANAAIAGQRGLTNAVISTSAQAEVATRKHTTAVQAYINALNAGKGANESEIQYQQRLNRLYVASAQAKVGMVNATARSDEAVRKSVDGVTKLRDAGNQELNTAKERLKNAQMLQIPMTKAAMSSSERAKADYELAKAQAQVSLAEARRGDRLKSVLTQQIAAKNAIKQSTMTDAEKAASLDIVNREINKTRSELKTLASTPDPKKTVKVDTVTANNAIDTIKLALANLDGKVVTVTLKALKQGFSMGGIVGFAGGGKVSGPGGTDRVPAMLTAGEVVLTKKQQALVDGGMSIREALIRTGGAFNRGGSPGGRPPRRGAPADETYGQRLTRTSRQVTAAEGALKAAKKGGNKDNIAKAEAGLKKARKAADAAKDGFAAANDAAANARQSFVDLGLANFDQQAQARLKAVETAFVGTGRLANMTFKQLDTNLENDLKSIETNFQTTFTIAGQTFTGTFKQFEKQSRAAFRAFDIQQRTAQASLNATFDALTGSEQRLKDIEDAQAGEALAGGMADAQKAMGEAQSAMDVAQRWRDPKAIAAAEAQMAAARKQLADAERAILVSELQKTAATERAEKEKDRQQAQDDFNAEWEERRQTLTDALEAERAAMTEGLNKKLEERRALAETDRAELQSQLDAALALQAAKDAQQRIQEEADLQAQSRAWATAKDIRASGIKTTLADLRAFDLKLRKQGASIGNSLADGLTDAAKVLANKSKSLAKVLEDYLKLNSPAKKGPLSHIDEWFTALAPTLADGVNPADIAGVVSGVSSSGGGGKGSVTITLNVSDQTFAGMSREQADRVARDIKAALDRQIGISI